jgi:hypothetical protein
VGREDKEEFLDVGGTGGVHQQKCWSSEQICLTWDFRVKLAKCFIPVDE